jgi:hypothetical protein
MKNVHEFNAIMNHLALDTVPTKKSKRSVNLMMKKGVKNPAVSPKYWCTPEAAAWELLPFSSSPSSAVGASSPPAHKRK